MWHDGLWKDISCINLLKHVPEELSACLLWDVFQSQHNETKLNKKDYCADTNKIYILNVLCLLVLLSCDGAVQRENTRIYVDLKAKYGLFCNQNTNNNLKKIYTWGAFNHK